MSDLITGILFTLSVVCFMAAVLYKVMAGKFLFPKRESVLPTQSGILVKGEEMVRVLGPGSHWIRPKERVLLCDMRLRPMEISNFEAFTSDSAIIRHNLSAEYKVAEPIVYLASSANAADALTSQVRRAIVASASALKSSTILSKKEILGDQIAALMMEPAARFGYKISVVQVWDVYIVREPNRASSTANNPLMH